MTIKTDAAVVHAAVNLLKNEKIRADFEVYLKRFLKSLDVILPNPIANSYRVPAKRLGYILRVTKERSGVKRRTTDITIERDGRVTVRSPLHLTPDQIDAVVESKRLWIYRNLAQWQELNASKVVREWVNGETFLYLGRAYRLALVPEQSSSLRLKAGRFYLDRRIVEEEGKAGAQKAFKAYFTAKLTG